MRSLLFPILLATAVPAIAQEVATPQEQAIKAHVAFLASDALRGREAGTHDYDVAAEYVAAQLMAAGVKPGGVKPGGANGSWMQPVPLSATTALSKPVAHIRRNGQDLPLGFATDFASSGVTGKTSAAMEGRLVFVGQGIVDPSTGRDDYRGLDVRDAIVVMLQAPPKGMHPEVAAHLSNRNLRARIAASKGAKAMMMIVTPSYKDAARYAKNAEDTWQSTRMSWLDASGTPRDDGVPSLGSISYAGTEKLFAGSKLSWRAIEAAQTAGKAIPKGPLSGTLHYTSEAEVRSLSSANVVGVLPGSDPALAGEYVVLSAHLDHLGVTKGKAGDAINNGAMDNATGIAALLEVARMFQQSGARPRRSVMFLAVTAEEKGLLGSDYFARNPTVPKGSIVANINMDMPILIGTMTDVVAQGGDRSSIGPTVAAAARSEGLTLTPEPQPEEAFFVRTDHYSFVQQGVPSVSLDPGPGNGGLERQKAFLKDHYHKVSDDISLPINYADGAKLARVNYAIATAIANADTRPTWNAGDYFGTLFRGPMAP